MRYALDLALPQERSAVVIVLLDARDLEAHAKLTEDLGHSVASGFRLIGRARGAEPRGCSLAMEELMAVVGRKT